MSFFEKSDKIVMIPKNAFQGSDILCDKINAKENILVVLFYADWCGHCQTFKPIYKKLAKMICCNNLVLGAVDMSKDGPKIVSGFPSILTYKKSGNVFKKISEFNAERTEKNVLLYSLKDTTCDENSSKCKV